MSYSTGAFAVSAGIGDFNGDGRADLAVANQQANNVSILLGKGDGTFGVAVNYTVGTNPDCVVVGDFNGDGKADLVVANGASNNVSVLLGNGDGTFQTAVNYAADAGPRFVAVGDFNGDGKADLAIPKYSGNDVSVLLGNGDGTFQKAVNYGVGINPQSVAVGDFECVPRLWPLLRDRPATRSAAGHGRRALPSPPAPACGVHRARHPFSLCPERRRRDTARYGSANTDTRGAATRPRRRRSARAALASPGNEPCDRRGKAPRAHPDREDYSATTGSARTLRLDAWLPASPSRPLPGRVCRSCAGPRRPAAAVHLLPFRLPAGWFPPFFFLRRQGVFDRPCAADLLVDFEQFTAQFPETVKVLDFALRLAHLGGRSESFTDRFPIYFAREPEVGAVARLVWLMTTALRFPTATADGRDGTDAKITQIDDAGQNGAPLLFERKQRVWQVARPIPNVSIR